ncbi:MAG TPA: DUF2167 domain-containing protein [Candidatus Polarisedimenticolaceae bacterium]
MLHRAVRRFLPFAWILVASPFLVVPTLAQQDEAADPNPFSKIPWTEGPAVGRLGDRAELDVPEGFLFSGAEGTRQFLELTQNIPSGRELGVLLPIPREGDTSGGWFVIFEFADVGYVKDDEKDKLDAKAILESIREGTDAGNKVRSEKGWPTLEIVGWEKEPFYDTRSNNLTWAVRNRSQGADGVNWSTRLLGREGYMNVDLVLSPEDVAAVVPRFESVMGTFRYVSGHSYAEFRKGDKIAAYGLTALVAGGAGALAVKTGILQKFWKLIVGVLLAAGAGLKKLWDRFRGESRIPEPGDPAARG